MMGSKYVQSSTENIFGNVKKDVEAGKKVLFTGTPCQIAAIKSFLKKDYIQALAYGFTTISNACALALGVIFISTLYRNHTLNKIKKLKNIKS